MFEDKGPVGAATVQQEYLEDYASKIDPDLKEKLREKNREISPVPKLLGGMEILYVIATEKPLSTVAGREATLQTLGTVATASAIGQFGGADIRDRAWALAAWAAYQLDPVGTEPAVPDVDPLYSTVPPPPMDPGPGPV